MSDNLKTIAERVRKEHTQSESSMDEIMDNDDMREFEVEESEDVVNPDIESTDDDDDAVVIGGISDFGDADDDTITEDDLIESDEFNLTDDDLRADMPDLSDEAFLEASGKIRLDLDKYRKNLIINNGLTVEEANMAALNRAHKLGKEENDSYLEENPKVGVVEIDKRNVDKVEFTPEERNKLMKVKSIQLKVVEDATLKTIPIEKVDRKHKSSMIQSLDTNLSQYSVPLPLMSDYCRFKGSQIIQLIQAVRYDDATLDEIISKKASLVYNQLANGANLRKYDDNGKVIMSYQDFINTFLYHDLDMALYGILVASSMESIESSLTCTACDTQFQWKYNLKKLLNLDDLSDSFKQRFDEILANKSNEEYLQNMYKENHKKIRVESPITKNIYDLDYPTIARAINLYHVIDQKDETMLFLSAFALFISDVYVYNKKTEKYIPVEETEYRELMDILQMIPQEEIDLIQKFLQPYLYAPKFILESKCPTCGNDMKNELSIDDLVFLKARDSSTEIQ